jgi:hypothetical protein
VKKEFNTYIENLKNKDKLENLEIKGFLSQIKNIVKSHSSRQNQLEDRTSGLRENVDIMGKKRYEYKQKRMKNYERCMQALCISIKTTNLRRRKDVNQRHRTYIQNNRKKLFKYQKGDTHPVGQ